MDGMIELARGPLFRIALAVCLLGLGYRLVVTVAQIAAAWYRAGDRRLPWRAVGSATLGWILPRRLWRARPVYSTLSVLFHLGVTLVPVFLAGHAVLLAGVLPLWWPTLPAGAADLLTVVAMVALGVMVAARIAVRSSRAVSKGSDFVIPVVLLLLLLFGWWAANPAWSPFEARPMLLLHILFGDLVLILIPLTKITHCALYPFTRLVFQLGWHFPAETGRHVARALDKEGEPV